eukprot:CAMPEP_0198667684 /NCGR_PEP_ID=MMETSP1467-20131203/69571_1 /TAXON_ID=1462469 /ORGANISM="unid. sp., Strain CCMP2135" /LENGTH=82 /DNA_ID=CAMNT_0044404393 /DNA_START=303 /DNA_END=547 /DNA_ORIENTATION=+
MKGVLLCLLLRRRKDGEGLGFDDGGRSLRREQSADSMLIARRAELGRPGNPRVDAVGRRALSDVRQRLGVKPDVVPHQAALR